MSKRGAAPRRATRRRRSAAQRSRSSAATRSARTARARRRSRPGRLRRIARGDRPFIALLLAVIVLVGAMAVGPLQGFTAAVERVDGLERTRQELRAEVDALEERRARLSDPEELELLARTELGMVKPGEIPYVVVDPEADAEPGDDAHAEPSAEPSAEPVVDAPWHRRVWEAVRRLFTDDS